MKIKLNELVTEAHGKMCSREGSPIFALNSTYDTQYVYHTHKVNPRIANPTDSQVAKQNKFANTIAAIKAKKQNAVEWEAVKEGFKAQTKYKTLWNYAFSVCYPEASVTRS